MKKNHKAQAAGRLGGLAKSEAKTKANRDKAATTAKLWQAMRTVLDKKSA